MMNTALFNFYLAKNGDTQDRVAADLGISLSRLSAKINEWHGAEFWQSEILFFVKRWNLTADEVETIFFAEKVS